MFTLLIRLNGPLQSWGYESLYDNRNTEYYPTKSGVIGMIAAALGRAREDSCEDLNSLLMGIRIDRQGILLKDFQITDMGEKLNKNLSKRVYLSDATFLVGLSSEDYELLKKIQSALHHPKYCLFLGRKSCPPTLPLELGIENKDLYQSLLQSPWLVSPQMQSRMVVGNESIRLRIIVESKDGTAKKDLPVSFKSTDRRYAYRYVVEMPGKVIAKRAEEMTEHDPMRELEDN